MYHNIDKNLISTKATWPYIGYSASGHKYYINRIGRKYWRAAQAIVTDNSVPYFYKETLRDISANLETI